MKIDKKNLFCR